MRHSIPRRFYFEDSLAHMTPSGKQNPGPGHSHRESELLHALIRDPSCAELWLAFGELLYAEGRFQQSASALQSAAYLAPAQPQIVARLVESCIAANLRRLAVEFKQELLSLDYGALLSEAYVDALCVRVDQMHAPDSKLALADLPRISVGIPTRERLESIAELINSLRLQSFKNFELIISDDSSDDSLKAKLAERFPDQAIKYLRGPRENAPANRQNILRHADFPLLVVVDDDHILEPDCLELLVRAALENPFCGLVSAVWPDHGKRAPVLDQGRCETLDLCSSSISDLDPDGFPYWRQGSLAFSSLYEPGRLFSAMTTGGGCVLYRRDLLSLIGGLPKRYSTVSFRDDASVSHLMYLWGFYPLIQPKAIAWHNRCETGGTRDTKNWGVEVSQDAVVFMRQLAGWREAAFRRRALLYGKRLSVALLTSEHAPLPPTLFAALQASTELEVISPAGVASADKLEVDLVVCADLKLLSACGSALAATPLVLVGDRALLAEAHSAGREVLALISDLEQATSQTSEHYTLSWSRVVQTGLITPLSRVPGMMDQTISHTEFCLTMFLCEALRRARYPVAQAQEPTLEEVLENAIGVRNSFHGGRQLTEILYTKPPDHYRPYISLLIPVCSEVQAVRELLSSLLSQSFANFEIVLAAAADLDSIAWPNDERVRVVHSTERSAGRLLNTALGQATGRWVSWLDHGRLYPNALETMVQVIEQVPSERAFLFSGYPTPSDDVRHLFSMPGELQMLSLLRGMPLAGVLPVVRRSITKELQGFGDHHGHSVTQDFVLRSAAYFFWELHSEQLLDGPPATIDRSDYYGCMTATLDFIDKHDLTRMFPWLHLLNAEHAVYLYAHLLELCLTNEFNEIFPLSLRGALMARAVEWHSTQATDTVLEQMNSALFNDLRPSLNLNQLPLATRPYYAQFLALSRSRFWYRAYHPYKMLNIALREFERKASPEARSLRDFLIGQRQLRS